MFRSLDDLILHLDHLFGVIGCGAEVTQLGARAYDADLRDMMAYVYGRDVSHLGAIDLGAEV
jgi:hypothetical protein